MPQDGSGGLFLSLLTESYAVRALLGSLAATGLAALAVRFRLVRTARARRLLVLAPVAAAAAAAVASVASVDEAYLPQLWFASRPTSAAGTLLDLLGELRVVSPDRGVDLLAFGYGAIVAGLLSRRVLGALSIRRLLRRAAPAGSVGSDGLLAVVGRLSAGLRVAPPRVLLLERCPGGAFTLGVARPVVVVDPVLLQRLDERELEGLVAHELAHIGRRDTLLTLVVGVVRDLTFFLPPVHLAARWLGREREESADELASAVTHRPVALASSILKVWDSSHSGGRLRLACGAVPSGRRPALAGVGGAPTERPVSDAAKAITARVERLIEQAPAISLWRRRGELALAVCVLAAAASTALVVPAWIVTDLNTHSLMFGYLSSPAPRPYESPAFSTFRALAPPLVEAPPASDRLRAGAERSEPAGGACPCVETQAQLHAGEAATVPDDSSALQWKREGHDPWEGPRRTDARARPLWTLSDSGPQVGFFVVRPTPVP